MLSARASLAAQPSVAYVLKGYPRISEMFIASEIHRLEQAGMRLRLFVIKPSEETRTHPVVERIRAKPDYLPACDSLSGVSLPRWLFANLGAFLPATLRVTMRRPSGVARAAAAAAAQCLRARPRFWSRPRWLYVKEFLQASVLANRVLAAPDVVHLHAHFCHGATTVAWLASMITGIPYSFTAHAKDVYVPSLNPAGLLRRKLNAARFAVTCTEANRLYLQSLAPRAVIHRVYHGLNADLSRLLQEAPPAPAPSSRQAPGRAGAPAPALAASTSWRVSAQASEASARTCELPANGSLRILAVGSLVPKKGFDILVEACAILAREGVHFEAVIAGGGGDHEAAVRRLVASLGLTGRLSFAGSLSQSELYREFRRASMFCLPCRVTADGNRDGIPNVLVEAMACGLPVVTTGVSGIPELIANEVNGLLVPPEDPQALAEALLRLHHDRALAARLSREGRGTVTARFDGDALAHQLSSLFREVMA